MRSIPALLLRNGQLLLNGPFSQLKSTSAEFCFISSASASSVNHLLVSYGLTTHISGRCLLSPLPLHCRNFSSLSRVITPAYSAPSFLALHELIYQIHLGLSVSQRKPLLQLLAALDSFNYSHDSSLLLSYILHVTIPHISPLPTFAQC